MNYPNVLSLVSCSAYVYVLSATCGQDDVPFNEGDPGLLCTGSSEKRLDALVKGAAGSIVILHCLVLNLLDKANKYLIIIALRLLFY